MNELETALTALEEQHIPQSIDFTVDESFVKNLPQILSNIDELKSFVLAQTEADSHLVLVSDEDFANARERCAQLNKVVQNIESKRRDVKKSYTKPLDIFEKKLKEVTTLLTQRKDNLWSQITAKEEEIKARKEKEYRAYWESLGVPYRRWEQIFDKSWLNKGTSKAKVLETLDDIATGVKNDILAIDSLQSEFGVVLVDYYKQGHSVTETIGYHARLTAEKTAREQKVAEMQASKQPTAEQPTEPQETAQNDEIEEIFTVDFRVWVTPSKLDGLKKYLNNNGIRFGKVE